MAPDEESSKLAIQATRLAADLLILSNAPHRLAHLAPGELRQAAALAVATAQPLAVFIAPPPCWEVDRD